MFFRTIIIHRMFVEKENSGGSQVTSSLNWCRLGFQDVKLMFMINATYCLMINWYR
jgi:hypothetical protein